MATKLQDYQAKRKELQATNPNATMLDAKSALSPIANAPVAWQAPAITPIAPVPVAPTPIDNKQVLADNQAKVASEIQAWTRPEVWQQIKPIPTQKPIDIPSQLTPQDQATIDRMTAEWRFLEAPTVAPVTPTPEVKTPKEPKPTEVVQPPATVQGIFTALATKADIPDAQKALPSYKIAQNRFTKANMYSSMTPAQLAQDVNDAKIVEWSPAWEDIKMLNPKLVKDVQNLNTVNGTKSNIFTYVNNPDGTKTKENNLVKTFVSDYEDNYWDIVKVLQGIYGQDTAEEARAKIYTPDVKSAEDKATQIELEMNALSDTMAWVDKDVEKELAGTGATWSRIALEKQYRNEQLTNKYNSLQKNYTTYANKANNLITQNTDLYKTEQAQKAQLNNALAGIAIKWYETQQEDARAEAIAQATLNDPTKAIPALIEQYTKLGVPMQRSVQEMIAEAQNEIANGWTLAGYLTKLQQTIQSKPEYKRIQEMQQGQMTDFEKMQASQNFELGKMGMEQDFQMALAKAKQTTDSKWTKLDDWLYTNDAGEIMTADDLKTAKLIDNSYLQKSVGEEGGECGVYASRGVGMSSTPGGNSKEARTKAFSETTPQVGWMVFFGWAWYDPTYGHISIVTSVNQDGTITVKDSNYSNDKKVQERTVPASTATGFYNNTPLANGLNWTTGESPVSSEANSWVNAWNNGTMDIETILTKIGSTKEALPLKNEVIQAIDKQGWVAWRKEEDPMVAKVQSIIDTISKSKNSKYVNTIAGNVQTSLSNFLTQGKSDLLADLKTIVEWNTLQALIDAKAQWATFWALSNEELKMLQATSSSLGANAIRDPDTKEIIWFKMSEEKLRAELEKMRNLFIEKKKRMTGDGIRSTNPTNPSAPVVGDSQWIR